LCDFLCVMHNCGHIIMQYHLWGTEGVSRNDDSASSSSSSRRYCQAASSEQEVIPSMSAYSGGWPLSLWLICGGDRCPPVRPPCFCQHAHCGRHVVLQCLSGQISPPECGAGSATATTRRVTTVHGLWNSLWPPGRLSLALVCRCLGAVLGTACCQGMKC